MIKSVGRNLRDLLLILGLGPKLNEQDRRVLESKIFPYLVERDDIRRVLDVGCHWYTWHYQTIFRHKEYHTIEIDPARRRYGAKSHVIDSIEHLDAYFEADRFDLVMLNGVIGWGLDDERVANSAVEQIRRCLRPGGILTIGWDDVAEHRPFDIEAMSSLQGFEPFIMPPLGTSRFFCDESALRHTLNFYQAVK